MEVVKKSRRAKSNEKVYEQKFPKYSYDDGMYETATKWALNESPAFAAKMKNINAEFVRKIVPNELHSKLNNHENYEI